MKPTPAALLSPLALPLILLVIACAPATPQPPTAPPRATEVARAAPPAPTAAAKPTATPEAKPAEKPAAFDARAVEEFYRGKNVKIIVGFSAGGGYDTYARLIARHMPRFIPGNPNMIVENMPGAGSLLAANNVYSNQPKDGTVIAHFIGGMITQKIVVQNPAVQFDPARYNWVGGPTPDTGACAVRKESGFTSLDQAFDKELILGGLAPGSTTVDIPKTLSLALGLKIKLVEGYPGTADVRAAADKGEVHGGCWGWESISVIWKEALAAGDVRVLGQGGAKKHAGLSGVPHFLDFAKTDDARKLIEAGIVAPGQISRAFALPPDVPRERVEAIRSAFLASLKSPELLADAQKAGLDIDPVPADEYYARVRQLQDLSPDLKQKLKAAIGAGS